MSKQLNLYDVYKEQNERLEAAKAEQAETWQKDGEYEAFVEKFKPKHTSDDCMTPPLVYEAVREWAVKDRGWEGRPVIRPFYPDGDYIEEEYPDGCVVIDNPPFSILSEIVRFYERRGIDYFLFCSSLTNFGLRDARSHICVNCGITYENGATIGTGFVCSKGARIRSAPSLKKAVDAAMKASLKEKKEANELPVYKYPDGVLSSAAVNLWSEYGIEYEEDDATFTRKLDAQEKIDKTIFGGGFLVPRKKAEEARKKAEEARKKAEEARKKAEEARKKEREIAFEFSERELEEIERLEGKEDGE